MTSIEMQRNVVSKLKNETYRNINLLRRLRPMSLEYCDQISADNTMEKLTQNSFNQLSHYLVSIIDFQVAHKFSWPLYDTKTERIFRGQLSAFINDYSAKGLLSPVMSSYLVNPGCYKVTLLIYEMSQLAVELTCKRFIVIHKDSYNVMSEKYKSGSEDFVQNIVKETDKVTDLSISKISNYFRKTEALEKIAALFKEKIIQIEKTLQSSEAQKFLDNIVDQYVNQTFLDENSRTQLLNIKNVNKPSMFFVNWLEYVDSRLEEIESKWSQKVNPFLKLCSNSKTNTEMLVARHIGESERSSYCIEYNHETDKINTDDLQNEVNSEQKFILQNIIRDQKLYFPNLIRGYLISVSYILNNNKIATDIFQFNEVLQKIHKGSQELIPLLKDVNERVMLAESKLQCTPTILTSVKEFEIPPLPDISEINFNSDQSPVLFTSFTPLTNKTKYQFNLKVKQNSLTFTRPHSKPIITPFQQRTQDDFIKSLVSCKTSSYDCGNISQNFHNISNISENHRRNETVMECSTGFTKQQIARLLSTRKSSSSKKFKFKKENSKTNIKKCSLFNESAVYSDSNVSSAEKLRSYSSPNLFERCGQEDFRRRARKLSVMQERSPMVLEVSGVALLKNDESSELMKLDNSRKIFSEQGFTTPSEKVDNVENILKNIELDIKELETNIEVKSISKIISTSPTKEKCKDETPKVKGNLNNVTNSLEKIINRFKKVRANMMLPESREFDDEFRVVIEDKDNVKSVNVDVSNANRILLPDLLSPNCSAMSIKSVDYSDKLNMDIDELENNKPRQSLGTLLGVDETFLDQFKLCD
ncbi:hypothetical protein ACJJTC_006776 [Scirpophaga incertulas]